MRINFLSIFKSFCTNKQVSNIAKENKKTINNIVNSAEAKLRERLVSYETLMEDFYTGDILVMKTGEKFTGKYFVPADKLEHIYHIKNGNEVGSMVRLKTGQKQWAGRGNYSKDFKFNLPFEEAKLESEKMIEADLFANERMRDNFVIQQTINSPNGSVYLTK